MRAPSRGRSPGRPGSPSFCRSLADIGKGRKLAQPVDEAAAQRFRSSGLAHSTLNWYCVRLTVLSMEKVLHRLQVKGDAGHRSELGAGAGG